MMMNSVYRVPLPDTSMETIVPESRRCHRRIFFLARHSRNTKARRLSLAESGRALMGASLPRVGQGGLLRIKDKQPKKETTRMKTVITSQSSLLPILGLLLVLILVGLAFVGLFFAQRIQGVNPPPTGVMPGETQRKGQGALLNLTSDTFNTAVGLFSLKRNTQGEFNTALGAATLLTNTAE